MTPGGGIATRKHCEGGCVTLSLGVVCTLKKDQHKETGKFNQKRSHGQQNEKKNKEGGGLEQSQYRPWSIRFRRYWSACPNRIGRRSTSGHSVFSAVVSWPRKISIRGLLIWAPLNGEGRSTGGSCSIVCALVLRTSRNDREPSVVASISTTCHVSSILHEEETTNRK